MKVVDGAIHNDDSAEDILNAPLKGVHCRGRSRSRAHNRAIC
jgi:hypothetical protein